MNTAGNTMPSSRPMTEEKTGINHDRAWGSGPKNKCNSSTGKEQFLLKTTMTMPYNTTIS